MKFHYKLMLLVIGLTVFGGTQSALAQSELVVEWADADGDVVKNALRDAIANDTDRPDDRVYKLKRGGFYWNEERIEAEGFHLRIIGETADEADPTEAFLCGPNMDEDCGPAIIQRVHREDGTSEGLMVQTSGSGSHVTMKHVWLMGQTDQGVRTSWQPFRMNASDSRYVFDYVVFDRNDWQHLGSAGADTDLFVTNSLFRNIFGPDQQWKGMGMQFDAGADTVVVENNTFLNMGFTTIKNEAAPINYFRANHNTYINVGRTFSSGAVWKEAYVTNNVFVNYFWHGEQPSEYEDPNREPAGSDLGFFGIWPMPSQFGTDFDRRIVLANNSFWRDDKFAEMMPDNIRSQPVVSDSTQGWFAAFDGMVMQSNFNDMRPDVATYPADIIPSMVQNITELRGGSSTAALYHFDPERDETCFECNVWPVGEDFSYPTSDPLFTGGTDGLPLGDLNWFPDAKEDFLANHAANVQAVEDLAGARIELTVLSSGEADDGTLTNAEIEQVEGFTYYLMESSGFIEWPFEIPAEGTYDLAIGTRLAFGTKGQHMTIDGKKFKNHAFAGNGEFVFSADVLGGDWVEYRIKPDSVWVPDQDGFTGPEILTLDAGSHTFRIEPSWGFQHFSSIAFIDPATEDTVARAIAPDATAEGVVPNCDESDFCPSGFKSVALDANGSVALNFDFPSDGQYLARIYYDAPNGGMGRLLLDGSMVAGINFSMGQSDLLSAQFTGSAGTHTLTIESDMGGFNVDYLQLIAVSGGPTSSERYELPEGYVLEQNYPNPFNPTTTISFTMANSGDVRLTVYDLMGRKIATLVDRAMPVGTFDVTWDATANSGLASGVYFYRLETPVGQQIRSMVLLK